MITIASRTPNEKNAGPAVPVPKLRDNKISQTMLSDAPFIICQTTYARTFRLAENHTKNIWYHRVSVRSATGMGAILA